jgi:hypothetical protein
MYARLEAKAKSFRITLSRIRRIFINLHTLKNVPSTSSTNTDTCALFRKHRGYTLLFPKWKWGAGRIIGRLGGS